MLDQLTSYGWNDGFERQLAPGETHAAQQVISLRSKALPRNRCFMTYDATVHICEIGTPIVFSPRFSFFCY